MFRVFVALETFRMILFWEVVADVTFPPGRFPRYSFRGVQPYQPEYCHDNQELPNLYDWHGYFIKHGIPPFFRLSSLSLPGTAVL